MKNLTKIFAIVLLWGINNQLSIDNNQLKAQDNNIGIGLFGLVNRNFNFTYERKVTEQFSGKINLGFLIPGKLPHLNTFVNILSDEETEGYFEVALKNLRFSGINITPEIRYYPGKKCFQGLYLGPYAKYAIYMFNSEYSNDVDYTDGNGLPQTKENVVFELTGNAQKIGAGLLVGYQYIVNDKFSIDFGFFGPGLVYCGAKSNVRSPNFPSEENIGEFVENELSVIPDIFGNIKVKELSDIEAQGKWARILPIYRINICVGYTF